VEGVQRRGSLGSRDRGVNGGGLVEGSLRLRG